MSSRPQIPDTLKKDLRAVLLSKSGGVELNRILSDYKKFVGSSLPLREYGYNSVQRLLENLPDVAQYALASLLMGEINNTVLLLNLQTLRFRCFLKVGYNKILC